MTDFIVTNLAANCRSWLISELFFSQNCCWW